MSVWSVVCLSGLCCVCLECVVSVWSKVCLSGLCCVSSMSMCVLLIGVVLCCLPCSGHNDDYSRYNYSHHRRRHRSRRYCSPMSSLVVCL